MASASVLPSGGTTLLLEREAQVAAFEALADGARSGGGRFVVVEGSAGIGKTRLLAEARAIAGGAGMRVLAARGGEFEGEFAYGIVRQLFEPLLASASPELRAELLSGPAALIEPLVGASQLAESQDLPAEGSFAILHGLYWLAANVAFHQPTLLAIDDVHWADIPSLRWLLYLTRRLEGVPLLVAAATRPPEGESRDPTLVAELVADPEAVAIRPEPLGRDSIAVLARELHGLEPDEAFCAALETATGGNPLFVGAVLDAVAREGTSPTAEHAPRLLEMGALGVARAVGLRLARLPPEALALLRAASILGDGTELRHAAALAGVEAGELGPAAAALVRLDLLRREDPLEFFHPVVRSAVYETLDVVERDAAHRSAAELLLQAGAPPESAAGHLLRVAPRADSFVVSTLRQAAERSLAQGAAEVAVGYLTRVLDEQHRSGRTGGGAGRAWPCGAADERPGCGRAPARRSRAPCRPGRGAARSRSSSAARSGSRTGSPMPSQSSSRRSTRSVGSATQTSTSCSWRSSSARPGGALRPIPWPKQRSASSSWMRSTVASAARSCSRRWRTTSTGWGSTASTRSTSPGGRSRPGTCWRAARSRSTTR